MRKVLRVLQSILGYALTLALTACLVGGCLLTLVEALLTNHALHEKVALDDRVIDIQEARIDEEIRELAEKYSFAPETALDLITRDYVVDYGREVVAWWMGLMTEEAEAEAPFPETDAIEEAVKADELFRANTEDFMRRSIARDEVAYPAGKTLRDTVIPLRVSLVALMMPRVAERLDIPAKMHLLSLGRSVLLGAALALLALLMITQGRNRCLFGSVGLLAADALLITLTVAAALANLPQVLAGMSGILSLQLSVLLENLLPAVLLVEGVLLVLGVCMLLLYGVSVRRARSLSARMSA